MKIEGLLPLGRLDPGVRAAAPLDIARVADDARRAEELGYDGVLTEESKDDPFIVLALAAQATSRVTLATAVAVAFPRSPAITAMSAWTLARLSKGRFTLGLGSQVKGHIERRFGMRWSAPGPWLRDYVGALRAIWASWQHGAKLDYRSEHYTLNLMVPLFAPAPLDGAGPRGSRGTHPGCAGAGRVLRLDADLSRRVRIRRPCRDGKAITRVGAGPALGGDASACRRCDAGHLCRHRHL